ncbi:unnamed protein product, partial [Oppiella nova]
MSSGVVSAHILAKHNAITDWRQLMGPTKHLFVKIRTKFNEPNTIRGMYGLSDTRNATHGSDSLQSFERECKHFFPDFNPQEWFTQEMIHFRDGTNIEFITNEWIHRIKR